MARLPGAKNSLSTIWISCPRAAACDVKRRSLKNMSKIRIAIAGLLVAILGLSLVGPANAARVYNLETKRWEEASVAKTSRRGSPIAKAIVDYETKHKVGTIIVETGERRLYLVLEDGKALKYGIGVGREGFTWSGQNKITRKAEWPGWTPPAAMRKRVPDLPAYMPGGPDNPLGARALYIGSTLYRIHGTSEPWTIGQAVSSGCIRLTNEDVTDLYERVRVGATVVVR
jgi:lipoprotein-anchoring transpeptidase ErfK/SrfK